MSETRVPSNVQAQHVPSPVGDFVWWLRLLDDKRNGRERNASVQINRAFAHCNSFTEGATGAVSSVK